jgi:NAD(P)-dependent dehydrogenase (short-subunit alcohol dehydrogenase family)
MPVAQKVAIVTGASSGIGLGTAVKLAGEGMAVLGAGRDTTRLAELEATVGDAVGDSGRIATVAVDLTADDGPATVVEAALSRWGRIDYLINNAGVGSPKPLHETDDETLDQFLGIMLRAPFRLARDVIGHMQPGSAIINVTSTFAVGRSAWRAYSAAKGGLTSLTTHIAAQYGPQGIRCNAVAPGVTVTPMVEHRLEDPGFRKMQTEMTPHTRLGRVDDIASTIAFLCSEGGSFINGQTIVVDGGWSSTSTCPSSRCPRNGLPDESFQPAGPGGRPISGSGRRVPGTKQVSTWAELRARALGLAGAIRESRGPGTRVAVATENCPEIVELMFGIWAAECVFVPLNYKLHPREMGDILSDSGAEIVFASAKIGAALEPVIDLPHRDRVVSLCRTAGFEPLATRRRRSGCTGLAVLYQRHHRPLQGSDALAPQSDGDDRVTPRRLRRSGRRLQPGARCADVPRLRDVRPALCAARGTAGDPGLGRIRRTGVPRPLRAPPRHCGVPGAHHGPAVGPDGGRVRAICAP